MKEVGNQAAAAANANIHAAGFASKKWEMRAKFLGSGTSTLNPKIWLHSITNFEDVFTEGRVIEAKNRDWLWLPFPAVPLWPGDSTRQMSPKKYIQTVGPLVLMWRPGKPPMLGAPTVGGIKAKSQRRRSAGHKGPFGASPAVVIPMFVGIPTVEIEKKFDVESAVQKVLDQTQGIYETNETTVVF
jgi:hypothetical protein